MKPIANCTCCGSAAVRIFHTVEDVPVNSVLALESREEAVNFPTGTIALGFCPDCGFIFNTAFDTALTEYSERYDPTQAFSGTFNRWHRALAEDVVERFGLQGKRVIEIGCGKGEFLHLLAEVGDVEGVGFDPSYEASRDSEAQHEKLSFVADFYSEKYADVKGDAVCCKMTLEHISPAESFMGSVRKAIGDHPETIVFFQVPDVRRILDEAAFWDIYYEHCSYYSAGSLARLFRRAGFDVHDVRREYGEQYLMISARPAGEEPTPALPEESDLEELGQQVERFAGRLDEIRSEWGSLLGASRERGDRTVIWGSGSKGVSFLTTIGRDAGIEYAVDINTFRHGQHMLVTGQEIVSPEFLVEYKPDRVIVMNPVYKDEIEEQLRSLGLAPEVLAL